jgi:cytochrome P450
MIDFSDPAFVSNPYPALKELRAAGQPVWHEGMQMFLAARHSDANDVFRNKSLGRIFKEKSQSLSGKSLTGSMPIQF